MAACISSWCLIFKTQKIYKKNPNYNKGSKNTTAKPQIFFALTSLDRQIDHKFLFLLSSIFLMLNTKTFFSSIKCNSEQCFAITFSSQTPDIKPYLSTYHDLYIQQVRD